LSGDCPCGDSQNPGHCSRIRYITFGDRVVRNASSIRFPVGTALLPVP
jgi:hypothetical protein